MKYEDTPSLAIPIEGRRQRIPSEPGDVTSWVDVSLQILAPCLLSLSVFSTSLLTTSHLVTLLAVASCAMSIASTKGGTTDQIGQRQTALFLLILLNTYLISLTSSRYDNMFYGLTAEGLKRLLGMGIFALWVGRIIRRGVREMIRSPLDLAVLLLFSLISASFLVPYVLLRLNGLPYQAKLDVFWVVFLATPLYYVFRDSLHTELAIKRTFRMAFFPLVTVCLLSAVSLWPNVTAVMGIIVYGHLFHRFHQTGLRAGLPRMGEG